MTLAVLQHTIERLQRQQAALADFGSYAFREPDLMNILNRAAQDCATGLKGSRCQIYEYDPKENKLLMVAGYDWSEGIVGMLRMAADNTTPPGRAFITGRPVIIGDITQVGNDSITASYRQHNVVSTLAVTIRGQDGPSYGVLQINSRQPNSYDDHDIAFLTGFANVLAEAVVTTKRNEQIRVMLAEKQVFSDELKHRVRNNLQLINGMLQTHLNAKTSGVQERLSIGAISRRIIALSEVYEQLLGTGLGQTIELGSYLASLCQGLPGLQNTQHDACQIILNCGDTPLLVNLDTVTPLGMAVAEIVSNSYEHAMRETVPLVISIGLDRCESGEKAILRVHDNGPGFVEKPASKRHGVGLVRRLAQQVKGVAELDVSNGTTWTIHFPIAAEQTVRRAIPKAVMASLCGLG